MGPTTEQHVAARELLGYYHLTGGQPPGGFTRALINAFEHAGNGNFRKLAEASPEVGHAASTMKLFGSDALRDLAWADAE